MEQATPKQDQQSPERDKVGDLRMTDGAEIDGIVKPQPLEPVLRHHHAHIDVALAAPIELVPLEAEAIGTGCRFHGGDTLGHHLTPDAVSGDHCNPLILRHAYLRSRRSDYRESPPAEPT